MKKPHFLAFLLAAVLCVSMLPRAKAEGAAITRAELADAVQSTYEYITQLFSLPIEEKPAFSDTYPPYAYRILQAYLNGFMNGAGEGVFLPDESATKAQTAAAFYRLVQKLEAEYSTAWETEQVEIKDIDTASDWAKEAIEFMASTGLMSLDEGNFRPDSPMSEAETEEICAGIKEVFVESDDDGERIDFQTWWSERIQGSLKTESAENEENEESETVRTDGVREIRVQSMSPMITESEAYNYTTGDSVEAADILRYINSFGRTQGNPCPPSDGSGLYIKISYSDGTDFSFTLYPSGIHFTSENLWYDILTQDYRLFCEFIHALKTDMVVLPDKAEFELSE